MGIRRIIPILIFLALAGCNTDKNVTTAHLRAKETPVAAASGPGVVAKPKESMVSSDWAPKDVEVACAEKVCPIQVGVLLFVGPTDDKGRFVVSKCTAFLSAPDVVTSNGHCDKSETHKGFFVSQRVNGQKSVRELSNVIFKKFTPRSKNRDHSSADIAMFRMAQPITDMPPLEFASGPQLEFEKLITFSIYEGVDDDHFKIESRECIVRRHQAMFAFSMREAPDVIRTFNCKMARGTSGSPMFAPGSPLVQSVHFASDDVPALAKRVREEENRELRNYESNNFSLSTNVRCLDYPGARPISCVRNDFKEAKRRWSEAQQFEFAKISQREPPENMQADIKYSAYIMQLKSHDFDFEIAYRPKCRMTAAPLKSVPIMIETLRLNINEWGEFSTESKGVRPVTTLLTGNVGDGYQLQANWPPLSREMERPEEDIRKTFGSSFRVDIPLCPG